MKDSKFELRLCVLVTVSGFQVFLGKCTRKADNQNKNSSVHFWQSVWKSKVFRWSTFVENLGIFLTFLTIFRGIFDQLGQIGSFLRSKMSKIIPEFSKFLTVNWLLTFDRLSKMYQNIWHFTFAKGSIISQKCTEVWKPYRNAWALLLTTGINSWNLKFWDVKNLL